MSKINKEQSISELKDEIQELKKTIKNLTATVNELKNKLEMEETSIPRFGTEQYRMFTREHTLEGDASWDRLISILQKQDSGRTATELAKEWGKSRSRTSEVLNQLVDEGRLVKFRDGRRIRFRPAEE